MLYLVPTPIGNLSDITLRAIEVLREADYILAEDTRTSQKLFNHHGIDNKLVAYHAHNEHKRTDAVLDDLVAGQTIALVTDAGTPGISDPAFLLVRACHEQEIQVSCLPGATAIIPAVVMSGFPIDRFSFEGFLPHKKGRQTRWKIIAEKRETVVLYESPHRIVRCLKEAAEHLGPDRGVAVIREISKLHEQVHRGTVSEVQAFFEQHPHKAKGEIVIVIDRPA